MEQVLTNARLVLPATVLLGTVFLRDGLIQDIQPGLSHLASAQNCAGDFLIPGVIDLHTDNLERQVQPRQNARWPSRSALLAHDAHCAAAGITTVLDALCVGDLGFDENRRRTCADGITDISALHGTGLLKSEHMLHLRCELPAPEMPELMAPLVDHPLLRLVSLMDHTPGGGQYSDLPRYRRMRAGDGDTQDHIERRIHELQAQQARLAAPNRAALLSMLAGRGLPLASHDDRTPEEVAINVADGIQISEFPVTERAATAARNAGARIIAGAPNLVRGGSHTGNIAVRDLLRGGLVDALASDYVPASLIEAAFLAHAAGWVDLPAAIALITAAPAGMLGLADRGRLAPGARADLARVLLHGTLPVVRAVWCFGARVT